ncbi:hypothetical protein CLV43_12473 [Umezawaea tangerina]|uniref:DUF2293 domain-containing protein n=1 Tax=Umezawaea tangerina TaxID=84725 RepID=A0A2T0SAD1_9PSEU|nr:hypothetical protein CLV43_12473 [Umezawaea tangerina]
MRLENRVRTAASALLAKRKFVAPLDLFTTMGWLPDKQLDRWRRGQVDHLGVVLAVTPDKAREALDVLRRWAESEGLAATEVEYPAATLDRRPLRFDTGPETAYRTHWMAVGLSETRRRSLVERQNKAPDLVVDVATADWSCTECRGTGDLFVADPGGPLCLVCADLDHLVFLGAGDATLTRRAKKASGLSAVVRRFEKSRKRYQRKGILVEEAALEEAEDSCLADEDVRLRRRERDRERRADWDVDFQAALAEEILRLFPRCPAERAEAIAVHAGTRGSGRVGRSAAGRALDERKTTLAVIASLRHEDTDYDRMLMSGVDRAVARERIRADVDRLLADWRG